MAVLPENMDKLNVEDPRKSLGVIENYIRYMGERIEFAMRNVTKSVSAAGMSSAEMYVLITAMGNELSALKSTVNGQSGQLTTLTGNMTAMTKELTDLKASQEKLSGDITSLTGQVNALAASVAAQNEALSSLEARVAALETKDGGA